MDDEELEDIEQYEKEEARRYSLWRNSLPMEPYEED